MAQTDLAAPAAPAAPAPRGYAFPPFRLDLDSYQLVKDEVPVDLTSKAFDTLALLLRHRHRVVTKEELLAGVWRDAVVTDDSLVQCVSALRRVLGDDASKPTYIATVARRGYRFIAPATEWVEAPRPADSTLSEPSGPIDAGSRAVTPPSPAVAPSFRLRSPLALMAPLALLFLAAGWYAGTHWTGGNAARPVRTGTLRFTQSPPPGTAFTSGGALSPDGRRLAFAAEDLATGRSSIWVRPLDAADARRLDGTEGAARPFWSPDSRLIGFFADGRLKTVSAEGGAPTEVAMVGPRPAGAAWNRNGQIIFSTWLSGFSAVSAAGGNVTAVTRLDPDEVAHAWPQFLPDSDHFLYSIYGGTHQGVAIGRVSTGETTYVLSADAGAIYSPLGYLVFTRSGVLTAQPFDAATRSLRGTPFNIVTGNVESPSMTNGTMLSAAAGLLTIGGARGDSELAWFDRAGRRLNTLTTPVPLHNPVLSVDEKRVFGNTFPPAQSGVWAVDLERGATSRLIPDASMPVPAPDGQRLAFSTPAGIFTVDLGDPAGAASETIGRAPGRKTPIEFTRDQRFLLYYSQSERGRQDLMLTALTGDRSTQPLVETPANEIQGRVSPDGRWLAYASDESGRWEVFVQSFPDAKSRVAISTAGGAEPQWRADGRELYYLASDQTLMAVDVTPGATLGLGRPRPLFRARVQGEPATYRSHYAVTGDGQRFLVDVLRDSLDPVTVLLDWTGSR